MIVRQKLSVLIAAFPQFFVSSEEGGANSKRNFSTAFNSPKRTINKNPIIKFSKVFKTNKIVIKVNIFLSS